jgi:hypothetical protein
VQSVGGRRPLRVVLSGFNLSNSHVSDRGISRGTSSLSGAVGKPEGGVDVCMWRDGRVIGVLGFAAVEMKAFVW